MEIIMAQTAGFCFGVKRAVDMAFSHAGEAHTFTYGPIIHNEVVMRALEQKGVYALDKLEGHDVEKLIIRSHGVSPEVYEESKGKGIEIVDATCPYVRKIHRYVEKYDKKGYYILIAGNAEHPEIKGINGWARYQAFIVKDVEELKQMNLPEGNYLFVAQTTYKKQVVDEMQDYLKEKGVKFEYMHTICNATKERQEEAITLSKQVDCMLILGSAKSANTKKLFEVSQMQCQNSHCIQEKSELRLEWFKGCKSVGITAGASTPQSVIDEVVEWINQLPQ